MPVEGIAVTTPAASKKQQIYKAITDYPISGAFLSSVSVAMAVVLPLRQQFSWHGWFATGALTSYSAGYETALVKYATVLPSAYVIREITPVMSARPWMTDLSTTFVHANVINMLALSDGLLISLAFMKFLAKSNTENLPRFPNAWKFLLNTAGMLTAIYAALGGFSTADNLTDAIFTTGKNYGADYGALDGQNFYCRAMNYTGTCPEPKGAWQILQNNLPEQQLITSTNEMLLFLITAGLPMLLAPLCSASIVGAKKIYNNRHSFFRAPPHIDPSPLLNADADLESQAPNIEITSSNS